MVTKFAELISITFVIIAVFFTIRYFISTFKKPVYELDTIRQMNWGAHKHLKDAWKIQKKIDAIFKNLEEDINKKWG